MIGRMQSVQGDEDEEIVLYNAMRACVMNGICITEVCIMETCIMEYGCITMTEPSTQES